MGEGVDLQDDEAAPSSIDLAEWQTESAQRRRSLQRRDRPS
jgi:hypothetical protein